MNGDPLLRLLAQPDPDGGRPALSSSTMDELVERIVLLGGSSDTCAQELGVLDEDTALRLLGQAHHLDVADRAAIQALRPGLGDALTMSLRQVLPRKLATTHGICPLHLTGRRFTVLVKPNDDPLATAAVLEELGFALSLTLRSLITTEALWAQATEWVYGTPLPPRLSTVLSPTTVDVDLEVDLPVDLAVDLHGDVNLGSSDDSGWVAVSPAAAGPTPAAVLPGGDDTSGWHLARAGQVVLPSSSTAVVPPVVVDAAAPVVVDAAVRLARRRQKVLWSVDDAIAELALCRTRDELLDVTLRFAYRRLYTAAIFVRLSQGLSCFDVLDPLLDGHDLKGIVIPVDDTHALGRAVSLRSPSLGPVDAHDPLCRLLGRQPRSVLVVPIVFGQRVIGAIVGDNHDTPISPSLMGDLLRLQPALQRGLTALVVSARQLGPEPVVPAVAPAVVPAVAPAPVVLPPVAQAQAPSSTASPFSVPRTSSVTVAPSPGAQAKEALLQATWRAWLAVPVDDDMAALVATLAGPGEGAVAAAQRVLASGLSAMPAMARAFPGGAGVVDDGRIVISEALLQGPYFDLLQRLGPDRAAPIVVGALDDPDRRRRCAAVVAARHFGLAAAVPALGRRLLDAEPAIASLAIDAVGQLKGAPGYDAVCVRLRDLCKRGHDHERRHAMRAVAALRDIEAVAVLLDLVGARPRELAEDARLALVELTRQDFGTAERRWRAWYTEHKHEPRRRWLLDALMHRDLSVRTAAADDLAEDGIALLGFHPGAAPADRHEALTRLCAALGERVPS